MATLFSEIDNLFLSEIKDYTFLQFDEEDREKILDNLRNKAIVLFKACKKDLSDRDDTLKQFNETLTDEEKLIIAIGMKKYWLSDKIYNLELLKQRMTTKDWKMTSQAEHLNRLISLKKELNREISNMIVSYTAYEY